MNSTAAEDRFKAIRAVVFDFDGTLAVLNIDFSLMRQRVIELMGRVSVEEGSLKEKYLLEIIDEVYEKICAEDFPSAETFYHDAHLVLHAIELEAAEKGRLLPGVKETLRTLRSRGFKIGIVTRNCEDAVKKVFPEIEMFCDIFISRDSTEKVKPHPLHLTAALRALKVSAGEAVMVGDHILDVEAGKKVGMMAIGVLTGRILKEEFEQAGADVVLNEATDVCTLLNPRPSIQN